MGVEIEGAEEVKSVLPAGGDLLDLLEDPDLGDLAGERRIAKRPNKAFFLRHFPTDWTVAIVDGEPVFVPGFAPHILKPGANGIRTRDRDEELSATYRDAVQEAIRQGWVYIPWSHKITDPAHLPPGVDPGKYIRDLKCKDRMTKAEGVYYVEAWNVPIATPPGQDQQFRFDWDSYNRWRASIVRSAVGATDGLVDPPMQSVIDGLRRKHGDRVGRIKARPSPDPQDRAAKVAAAERAAELVETAKPPAKKRAGRKA